MFIEGLLRVYIGVIYIYIYGSHRAHAGFM